MNFTFLFISMLSFTVQASPNLMITIRAVGAEKAAIELDLTREGKRLFCRTADVPVHEIEISDFKWTEIPFLHEKTIEPGCKKVISWGPRRQCYHHGRVRFVDDLIRKCSNI